MSDLSWVTIGRVVLRDRVMDVSDPDPVPKLWNLPQKDEEREAKPKLVLGYTRFDPNTFKAIQTYRHFVDTDAMLLLAHRIFQGDTGPGDPTHAQRWLPLINEYKGSFERAENSSYLKQDTLVSRQLTVTWTDHTAAGEAMRNPGYAVNFTARLGREGDKGQIMPLDSKAPPLLKESIHIPEYDARRLMGQVYRRLMAKEVSAVRDAYV